MRHDRLGEGKGLRARAVRKAVVRGVAELRTSRMRRKWELEITDKKKFTND